MISNSISIIHQIQRLLIYDICFSNSCKEQFDEYFKILSKNYDEGIIVFIQLDPSIELAIKTPVVLEYIRELSGDLFSDLIIGNRRTNEIICFLPQSDENPFNRNTIIEKSCVLQERLSTIFDMSVRIGIGEPKVFENIHESLDNAEKALNQSFFSVIHYSDLKRDEDKNQRGTISKFYDYIQANYANQIALDVVAKEVCVSPNYLSSILRAETGKSYMTHLTELRINKAKELLNQTNLTAKRIGELVGYPDAIYFTRVFKKQTGMTPLEYRDNC